MATDPQEQLNGTGRRLLSIAEAAEIFRVQEQAVRDWIDSGLISYVWDQAGDPRIVSLNEHHDGVPGAGSNSYQLELGNGISLEKRSAFRQDRERRQRELVVEGLDWSPIDADALARLLASRLAAVVPAEITVSVGVLGMLFIAGGGFDLARSLTSREPAEIRLREVSEQVLDFAAAEISEVLMQRWPHPVSVVRGWASSNATVADGQLVLSYGDPDNPLVVLEPIALSDVIARWPASR